MNKNLILKKYFFVFLFFIFLTQQTFTQNKIVDSLQAVLKKENADTNKVNTLNLLARRFYLAAEYDTALDYVHEEKILAEKINYQRGLAESYENIGNIYWLEGNYPEALKNYFAALGRAKTIGNKNRIENCYIGIGNIYSLQNNYSKALENYFNALEISKTIQDKHGIGSCYSSIGSIYYYEGNISNALKNYFAALKIDEVIGYKRGVATCHLNIGNSYFFQHNFPEALKNYLTALEISTTIGDKFGMTNCCVCIGDLNTQSKKYTEAKKYIEKAFLISTEIRNNEFIKNSYNSLTILDSATANWKEAYKNHKLFIAYRDSLINEANTKKIIQSQMQFDFDIKTTADSIKNTAQIMQQELKHTQQIKQQKTYTYGGIIGFVLMLIVAGISLRAYTNKRKANTLLEEKNSVIEKQKIVVEEKNKEITSSINYALRIQTAILPPQRIVKNYLRDSFIVYKPKDIVAGDFYWMENVDKKILFAACDCTGHGVPGAMVSVVCHNALNRAVREFGLTKPAAILDKTAQLIIENFSKSEDEIKDGMDISLCVLEQTENGAKLQWSGANSPLWILKNGELQETKADKQSVGNSETHKPFTNHEFNLEKGDTIYVFSDGFADQFGGQGEKKLTRKRFKELILSIQNKNLEDKGNELNKFISNYRKEIEQTDDILVMGVRV
ncbi:MAG: tetratricopeptide repeat protein [Bacteroidia bacterium]